MGILLLPYGFRGYYVVSTSTYTIFIFPFVLLLLCLLFCAAILCFMFLSTVFGLYFASFSLVFMEGDAGPENLVSGQGGI